MDATKLGTYIQCLFDSCLVVDYVLIKNPFLIETGLWFLKTFPIKKEKSSNELPEMQKQSSVKQVFAMPLMWEPAILEMYVLRKFQASRAMEFSVTFSREWIPLI